MNGESLSEEKLTEIANQAPYSEPVRVEDIVKDNVEHIQELIAIAKAFPNHEGEVLELDDKLKPWLALEGILSIERWNEDRVSLEDCYIAEGVNTALEMIRRELAYMWGIEEPSK